jgi:hypothetical protein
LKKQLAQSELTLVLATTNLERSNDRAMNGREYWEAHPASTRQMKVANINITHPWIFSGIDNEKAHEETLKRFNVE